MIPRINRVGQRFGKLLVKSLSKIKTNGVYWVCKCDCGKTAHIFGGNLTSGRQTACGCGKGTAATHGHSRRGKITPEYRAWKNMMTRCYNENYHRYPDWGGRGITVCKRWHDFTNFLADMGERPEGLTLERRHNDKGYSKYNCTWATRSEQAKNTRRSPRYS